MPTRIYASDLLRDDDDGGLVAARREGALASFEAFLPYWQFRNRETGEICSFEQLWEGQQRLAEAMEEYPWLLALKAGKLGFTELECAHDAWVALRRRNARVHIFSRDLPAAQDLLDYVRFGIEHLPPWLGLPIAADQRGGDTSRSLILDGGLDDRRTIVCYAAGRRVAIDQSATHSHVDELAHMPAPEKTWGAIQTTVVPNGTVHIVTRGGGDDNHVAALWHAAQEGASPLHPLFTPWDARPDRDRAWREQQATTLTQLELAYFAPESPEDALAGDEAAIFLPGPIWDSCYDAQLPPLKPGDRDIVVLGVDVAVVHDSAAVVAVTRHPNRRGDPAIRGYRVWKPSDHGGRIDLTEVERAIRFLCSGGCHRGHPKSDPDPDCDLCRRREFAVPKLNIRHIAYDPYQMAEMAQRLSRDNVAWLKEFPQGSDREKADASFYSLVMTGRLAHTGGAELREHVMNARAKVQPDEDSRMRMVKRSPRHKIDLAVAASMAVDRNLWLRI